MLFLMGDLSHQILLGDLGSLLCLQGRQARKGDFSILLFLPEFSDFLKFCRVLQCAWEMVKYC